MRPYTNPPPRSYSYINSILGFKLSLLLSYLRFFPAGLFRTLNTIVAVACVMFHISFLVVQINLCTPVRILLVILVVCDLWNSG